MSFNLLSGSGWILCHEYDRADQTRHKASFCYDEDEQIMEVIRFGTYHSYYVYEITEVLSSTRERIWVNAEVIDCIDYKGPEWSGRTYDDYKAIFEGLFGCEPAEKPMRELVVSI